MKSPNKSTLHTTPTMICILTTDHVYFLGYSNLLKTPALLTIKVSRHPIAVTGKTIRSVRRFNNRVYLVGYNEAESYSSIEEYFVIEHDYEAWEISASPSPV